ncbi:RDD family protein [Microbacterium sp. LRZ72]|uniref:RDD family protein n=1 Tax=Microbacterium sp. LRZ72 TaxID=2942481 RepID=UPI0029A27F40|nr:RDD family protein [Microbacterium sp. LRZ72]MDX2377043.1 RDD family protein [Microbacterium sp. LRZ72]
MSGAGIPELTHVHQDEVLTGEAVALDVQPVGLFLRALGAVIDLLIAAALLLLVFVIGAGPLSAVLPASVMGIATIVALVGVTVVLPTAVETASRGRSLGRLAVGSRIVRMDGGASGFRQAFIRALVGVFEIYFTLGVVAVITAAFTPRAQRLGDLLAGTYAQRTRVPPLPAPLPPVPPQLEQWAATADVARLPDRLARRVAQFLRQSDRLAPAARERIAHELVAEASGYVSPPPPADAVTALFAVAAVRRDREYRALQNRQARVEALAPAARAEQPPL